jgi:hypothetical protein
MYASPRRVKSASIKRAPNFSITWWIAPSRSAGWPRKRVAVIDDDLGKSGTSSAERYGLQRLIGEIGLGKADWS